MKIDNLPKKFEAIWKKALPLLRKGRPGDDVHSKETVETILSYHKSLKLDLDILVPVGMLHDIGHSAIMPEHFSYITGFDKVSNGKLVHMLVGAKIANDILRSLRYKKKKTKEIVDIISMHDFDQLKGFDARAFYTSRNKKIFHDIDSMDRFNARRLHSFIPKGDKSGGEKMMRLLEESLNQFFYGHFKKIAQKNLEVLRKDLSID